MIQSFDGYKEADLLKAHKMILDVIDDNAGNYRTQGVGVLKIISQSFCSNRRTSS